MRRVAEVVSVVAALVMLSLALVPSAAARGKEEVVNRRGRKLTIVNETARLARYEGNVQVMNGELVLDGPVHGNVVLIGGSLEMSQQAQIGGDLVALSTRLRGVDRSKVAGRWFVPGSESDLQSTEKVAQAINDPLSFFSLGVKCLLLAFWLAISLIVTVAYGREVRGSSLEMQASWLYSLLVGFVALTSLILTALVFTYLIPYSIGLPLLAVLGAFALVTKLYGLVVVFHAIGARLLAPRTAGDLRKRRVVKGDLAYVIVGLLVLGGIRLIPFVGNVAWALASVAGIGVTLATRFGRREPWFLEIGSADVTT